MDVLDRFLGDGLTRGGRDGAFVIFFVFVIAQLETNISANSLPAGTDMAALLPRFINIKHGGFVCAILALCICPWDLMYSSNRLTLASSCIAAIVYADYYIVRRGKLNLLHL